MKLQGTSLDVRFKRPIFTDGSLLVKHGEAELQAKSSHSFTKDRPDFFSN